MEFKTFWSSLDTETRNTFATACGTSAGHLRNVAYGKTCGESLAINIERESLRVVTCEELRPDVDWSFIRSTVVTRRQDEPAVLPFVEQHQEQAA
jgi:hypothetical protein